MRTFILLIPVAGGEPDFSGILRPGVSIVTDAEGPRWGWRRRGRDVAIWAQLERDRRTDDEGKRVHRRKAKIIGDILGRLPAAIDPQERFAVLCSGNRWAELALDDSSGKVYSLAEAWAIPSVQSWMISRGVETIDGRPKMRRVYAGHSCDPLRGQEK